MIAAGSLEYAHARLCARYGNRPDELTWRRIEMIRDFGAMLDAVRVSPLGAWTVEIGADGDVHAIEIALRAHFRLRVAAVAAWMPAAWRDAIEWCGVLIDLPTLQHLARGGAPPAWLRDDPLGVALHDCSGGRHASDAATLLAAGTAEPDRIGQAWRAAWRRRLPNSERGRPLLAEFVRLLGRHLVQFDEPLHVDGWALRRELHARLARLFRRALLDPAAAFIFLALSALDFERLRGEMLRRVAFPRLPLAA